MKFDSTIICYVSDIDKLRFFKKFHNSARFIKHNIEFWTARVSVKVKDRECFFLARTENCSLVDMELKKYIDESVESCLDLEVFDDRLASLYLKILDELKIRQKKNNITVFLWNGSTLYEKIAFAACSRLGIKTIFFEVGNMPGKLFVDPKGVNFKSSLADYDYFKKHYKKPEMIESGREWLKSYLDSIESKHIVKQSRNLKKVNYYFLFDWLAVFFGLSYFREPGLYRKIISKFKSTVSTVEPFGLITKAFYLFPAQVSTDSQILINSTVDNYAAIDEVVRLSNNDGVQCVVKLHPAEPNIDELVRLRRYAISKGCIVSSESIPYLLKKTKKVFTINSTVGLEAKMHGVPVCCFGDALYANFTMDDLFAYIGGTLLNIDYFTDEPVENLLMEKIMNRSRLCDV